jgi:hypothetical protein
MLFHDKATDDYCKLITSFPGNLWKKNEKRDATITPDGLADGRSFNVTVDEDKDSHAFCVVQPNTTVGQLKKRLSKLFDVAVKAPELPCASTTDPGTIVRMGDQEVLGPGTQVTAYPDAIAIRTASKIFYFWHIGGGWFMESIDPKTGGHEFKNSFFSRKLADGVSVDDPKGDTLKIRREGLDPARTVTFTLADLERQWKSSSEAAKKGLPGLIESKVVVSSPEKGAMGTFYVRSDANPNQGDAYAAQVAQMSRKDRNRASDQFNEETFARTLRTAPTTADLSAGEKIRTGCKGQVVDVDRSGVPAQTGETKKGI